MIALVIGSQSFVMLVQSWCYHREWHKKLRNELHSAEFSVCSKALGGYRTWSPKGYAKWEGATQYGVLPSSQSLKDKSPCSRMRVLGSCCFTEQSSSTKSEMNSFGTSGLSLKLPLARNTAEHVLDWAALLPWNLWDGVKVWMKFEDRSTCLQQVFVL